RCEGFFEGFEIMGQQIDKFLQIAEEVGNATAVSQLKELAKIGHDFEPPADLLRAFGAYIRQRRSVGSAPHLASKVCAIFLNIRRQPFTWVADAAGMYSVDKL